MRSVPPPTIFCEKHVVQLTIRRSPRNEEFRRVSWGCPLFNPVPVMKLVEVVADRIATDAVVDEEMVASERSGAKRAVRAPRTARGVHSFL